jgi:SnoaL-like domain
VDGEIAKSRRRLRTSGFSAGDRLVDLNDRLIRLEARFAINDLITDLAMAFDAGPSADLLRPLFTPDAVFVIDRYDRIVGGEAIATGVAGNAERGFKWGKHYFLPPKTTMGANGISAEATFYFWGVATSVRERDYWIAAHYTSRLLHGIDGWRFQYLELHAQLISHYAQGWTAIPESFDSV